MGTSTLPDIYTLTRGPHIYMHTNTQKLPFNFQQTLCNDIITYSTPHEIQRNLDKVRQRLFQLQCHIDQLKRQFVSIPPYLGGKLQHIGIEILYFYVCIDKRTL